MKLKSIILVTCFIMAALTGCHHANAQQKRAFIVGISDYCQLQDSTLKWPKINGANDVQLLTPILRQQGFLVTSLTNNKATKRAIASGLENLIKNCKPGDFVYIHFSMHGQLFEDKNGDEVDGWDEALIPYDAQRKFKKGVYEGENHLVDDEMEVVFNKIRSKIGKSGQLLVVIDACHSGSASRNKKYNGNYRGVKDVFSAHSNKSYMADITKETNEYYKLPTAPGQSPVTFLEACRSYQTNNEVRDASTNIWYGSLSYYVCQASKSHTIGSQVWIEAVKAGMKGNSKLRKQNMVIETSK